MEEKKAITAKILIAVIVVLVVAVVGLVAYILLNKNGNNNDTSNKGNTVNVAQTGNNTPENSVSNTNTNTQINTNITNISDPYANYPNFEWVRTTNYNYPTTNTDDISTWINNTGVLNILFPANYNVPQITINSMPEKAKYFTFIYANGEEGRGGMLVLTENNNLYFIWFVYDNSTDPIIQKIASNVIEMYQDPNFTDADHINTGIYALTGDGQLLSVQANYDPDTYETNYVLGTPY